MAQLDEVLRMINAKRAPPMMESPTPIVETPKLTYGGSTYLDALIETLTRPLIKTEDFQIAMAGIAAVLADMNSRISEVSAAVERRPDTLDPVISAVDSIKGGLNRLISAVASIEIPKPDIPEQKEVDLRPVLYALQDMKTLMEAEPDDQPETPEEKAKPRKWTFNVKRGQGGYIKSVEVEEEDD